MPKILARGPRLHRTRWEAIELLFAAYVIQYCLYIVEVDQIVAQILYIRKDMVITFHGRYPDVVKLRSRSHRRSHPLQQPLGKNDDRVFHLAADSVKGSAPVLEVVRVDEDVHLVVGAQWPWSWLW